MKCFHEAGSLKKGFDFAIYNKFFPGFTNSSKCCNLSQINSFVLCKFHVKCNLIVLSDNCVWALMNPNFWIRGLLHGEFQPGLKFCCDYMASFSPGWNLKLRWKVGDRHLVSLKTQSLSTLKLTFQPGLKFSCDYTRFFWVSARAENPSPVSQTGLEISARAEILST